LLLAAWRLAFHWKRPLSELNISRREFNQALAYLQIEPIDEGDNKRTASLMAQISNWSGRCKKWLSADDYLGKPQEIKPMQTTEQQKSFMRGMKGN
jgi:hypothetical protein